MWYLYLLHIDYLYRVKYSYSIRYGIVFEPPIISNLYVWVFGHIKTYG